MNIRKWLNQYPLRYYKIAISPIEINKYIEDHKLLLLNIGCQENIPADWLNVDVMPGLRRVYMDATNMKAVPDDTFDAVLCEHMIEHVSGEDANAIIRSIYRVLKPGGVARFVTPDFERLARLILAPQSSEFNYLELYRSFSNKTYLKNLYPNQSRMDFVNTAFYEWGHKYLYTRDELRDRLKNFGFNIIIETPASGFVNGLFDGVQGHAKISGPELNDLAAFAFETTK